MRAYYLKFRSVETREQYDACEYGKRFRVVGRALTAARRVARRYGVSAEIFTDSGELVLRVDSSGDYRAP